MKQFWNTRIGRILIVAFIIIVGILTAAYVFAQRFLNDAGRALTNALNAFTK